MLEGGAFELPIADDRSWVRALLDHWQSGAVCITNAEVELARYPAGMPAEQDVRAPAPMGEQDHRFLHTDVHAMLLQHPEYDGDVGTGSGKIRRASEGPSVMAIIREVCGMVPDGLIAKHTPQVVEDFCCEKNP